MRDRDDITELLNAAQNGDAQAGEEVYALIYDELKARARRSVRGERGRTLTPTALVSETYLRLCERARGPVRDREHFFALAARAMRQIMVDHARRRGAVKRGGELHRAELDDRLELSDATAEEALELDAALDALEQRDARLARLVELHFFAGLSFEDLAQSRGQHERTVRRDWELARAFLRRAIDPSA